MRFVKNPSDPHLLAFVACSEESHQKMALHKYDQQMRLVRGWNYSVAYKVVLWLGFELTLILKIWELEQNPQYSFSSQRAIERGWVPQNKTSSVVAW